MSRYTDTVDANIQISLHEYGIIRDPKTEHVVFTHYNDDKNRIMAESTYISVNDVETALQDQGKGFFDYIGSTLAIELDTLDADHLALTIRSLNQYNGWFF